MWLVSRLSRDRLGKQCPSIVGAGLDSNNYLDVENQIQKMNQGVLWKS
jgi:hypothetical protein